MKTALFALFATVAMVGGAGGAMADNDIYNWRSNMEMQNNQNNRQTMPGLSFNDNNMSGREIYAMPVQTGSTQHMAQAVSRVMQHSHDAYGS